MVDNVAITAGSGTTIATDDIGAGVQVQRVKATWGPDGTANDADVATGKPLPIQVRSATGLIPIGEPTDAKSIATDTTSASVISVLKQISASVQAPPSLAVTNVGTFAVQAAVTAASGAFASGSIASGAVASGAVASGAMVDLGAIADAAVTAGATGSLSAKLRAISRDLVANIVLAAGSAIIGKVGIDQTTPGTTDSVTVKSQAYSASVSLTRTADTNVYAANDILGAATGSTAALTFTSMGPSGGKIVITSVAFEIDAVAIISGETSYRLYLYNVTPPSALGDNAAFDLPSGDRASFLGYVDLGAPVDLGSTLYVESNVINKQLLLSGTSLFGYLVTNGTYTPTSARVHKITLHAIAP